MKILIPEPQTRNVLAAVRSLGRAGHSVVLAIPRKEGKQASSLRCGSRYLNKALNVLSPHVSPEGFFRDILNVIKHEEIDVLLPFTHSTVLPVSYYRDELVKHTSLPIIDYSTLRYAHDKLETLKLAQSLGISTPVTFHPKSNDELRALKPYIPYPCLVKARQGCGIGTTIQFAQDFQHLVAGYETIHNQESNPPINAYALPMIQEYVPGQIYDAVFLYGNGSCKAALAQERFITYPIQGGPGAVNQTTHDPELLALGQRLLDALGWHGPAQVEFKLDPRDGEYKLMEINPKFWGTLPLAMVAGIDFAEMACDLAYNGDVHSKFDYRVGVTYRWLFPNELYVLVQDPTLRRIGQFFQFWRPNTHYDVDLRDPMPDIARAMKCIHTALFNREKILPAQEELEALALQRSPAQLPDIDFGIPGPWQGPKVQHTI
jgi:predicted ATP-grasp superfamily ATP-dependent carboligase